MARNILGHRFSSGTAFYLGFTFIAFFALVPAIATVGLSFTDSTGTNGVPVHWVGAKNYAEIFTETGSNGTGSALLITFIFAVSSTVGINVGAFLIAVLLNRPSRLAQLTRSVVFLPTVLGVAVVGMIWTLFFNPLGGPAQSVLKLFGTTSAFFGDQSVVLGLVIFVNIWTYVGYSVVIYMAGLQAVPSELYEAAEMDGAGAFRRMTSLTIPLVAPSITTNVLICIIGALQSYQLIYVLTGAANPATSVLAIVMYRVAFGSGATAPMQGLASAISIVQFVLVGILAVGAFIILRRREMQL